MTNHPAQGISIYQLCELIRIAYPKAMTPTNIVNGFKITGIHPLNGDIFSEDEFLSSYVTDQPRIQQATTHLQVNQIY